MQTAYYVTNLRPQDAGPQQLLELARDYRGAVENGMYRVRDGTKLREDACRPRKGNQPRVLAAFNNLAILRLLGHKNISRHGGDESAPGILPGRGLKPAHPPPARQPRQGAVCPVAVRRRFRGRPAA